LWGANYWQLLDVLDNKHGAASPKAQPCFPSLSRIGHGSAEYPPALDPTGKQKPWIPNEEDECQFKCCHTCRPSCEPRTYLSLDGILRGDIPPSAVVGFGFHLAGNRPIVPAETVKYMGLRPVPWVSYHISYPALLSQAANLAKPPAQSFTDLPSPPTSASSMCSIFEGFEGDSAEITRIFRQLDAPLTSSECSVNQASSNGFEHATIQPCCMPYVVSSSRKEHFPGVQDQVALDRSDIAHDYRRMLPCSGCDPGRASLVPLPVPTPEEDASLEQNYPAITKPADLEQAPNPQQPLHVRQGVAFLEESVGLGIPDVITQG
jgi:hypothetical protein